MKRRSPFRRGLGPALLAVAALALAPGAAPGQPTTPGQPTPTLHGELALSIEEALAMGIENNLDVEIVRHDPLIATQRAVAAWGSYDPVASAEAYYHSFDTPIASALQRSAGLIQRESGGTAAVSGLVPKLGWSYEVAYDGARVTSNSSIQSLSPQYTAGLTGRVSLPLLKGFLWGAPWVEVRTTKVLEGAAYEDFRRQLMDVIASIENAYWEVIASREALRVANKSVETARALKNQTQAQYEVGVVSRVEVTEADAGVADREFNKVVAANRYLASQDQLIDLVLGPHLTPESRLEIRPTTEPEVVDYKVDEEEAAQKAFEHRPELEIAKSEVERQELNLKFAKNQRLPQVDVVGSYGYAGLAGKPNPTPPLFGGVTRTATALDPVTGTTAAGVPVTGVAARPVQVPVLDAQGNPVRAPLAIDQNYHNTDDDFFSDDGHKNWTAGLVFSIPLGLTRERADVRRARLEVRRARTVVRRTEQNLILEVRDAIRNLRSSVEGLSAAREGVAAAQEQLRAETIRLEHGESTPFDVLQREEDLVRAQSQQIAALQAYRNSVTALDRRQGTILRDRGIVVEEALALR